MCMYANVSLSVCELMKRIKLREYRAGKGKRIRQDQRELRLGADDAAMV